MRTSKAHRIRFGILAARHHHERSRLTPWQIDYLEGCEAVGWRVRDSWKAFRHEAEATYRRFLAAEWQAYLAGRISEFWGEHYRPQTKPCGPASTWRPR